MAGRDGLARAEGDGDARLPARVNWLRRRPVLAAALAYAALSLLMFSPALVPGHALSTSDLLWSDVPWASSAPAHVPGLGSNPDLNDSAVSFEPGLEWTRATLPSIPLWNPYIMGGRPYLGDAQSAVFSPFSLPAYVLPMARALGLIAVLKLFVAAFGTFLLGRALGMRVGAFAAGLVFGFSLWMVSWVSWPTSSVWAFLPWACLLAERLMRRPSRVTFVALAAVVGLQYLGGHPESSFDTLLCTVLFWVTRLIVHRPATRREAGAHALRFGGALLAGTALAAVVLVPFLELLDHSYDISVRQPGLLPAHYLLGIFLHDFWGRQTITGLASAHALEERAVYVGALALTLMAAALILRPRRERVMVAVLGALALGVAVGAPGVSVIDHLPLFSSSVDSRLVVIFVFSAALLAGWGLDELAVLPRSSRRGAVVVAISAGLAAAPVIIMAIGGTLTPSVMRSALRTAWEFEHPAAPGFSASAQVRLVAVLHDAALLEWLLPAAIAVGLVTLRVRGRLRPTGFAVAALVLIAADLFRAGMGYNPAIPLNFAVQPATGAIRYLQRQRPARFVGVADLSLASLVAPMTPDVAIRYRLYDARGYDFPLIDRYLRFWRGSIASSPLCAYPYCPQSVGRTPRALHALGLLGVTDIVQAPIDPPLGTRVAYAGPDARIYADPYALPRAFLVDRQDVVPDDPAELATVTATTFPARTVAVTERPLPGLTPATGPGLAAPGVARITAYEPETVRVQTRSRRRALLMLTDTYFPGWTATVDGRPAPIRRVDYLLRGVTVPAGTHRVEFDYQPVSWRIGWMISLVTLLGLAIVLLAGRRRPRAAG